MITISNRMVGFWFFKYKHKLISYVTDGREQFAMNNYADFANKSRENRKLSEKHLSPITRKVKASRTIRTLNDLKVHPTNPVESTMSIIDSSASSQLYQSNLGASVTRI